LNIDGRSALIFVLGAVVAIPLDLQWGPLGDIGIAYGLIGSIAVGAALVAVDPAAVRRIPRSRLVRLLAAFLVFSAVTTIIGTLRFHSSGNVFSFGFQVLICANFLVGYWFLGHARDLVAYFGGFVLTASVTAAVVAGSVVGQGCWYQFHMLHDSPLVRHEVYGWPNQLGVVFVVACLASILLGVLSGGRLRAALYLAALTLAGGVFITYSRTAYLVLAVGLLVLALHSPLARRVGSGRVVVLVAAGLLLQVGGPGGSHPIAEASAAMQAAGPASAGGIGIPCTAQPAPVVPALNSPEPQASAAPVPKPPGPQASAAPVPNSPGPPASAAPATPHEPPGSAVPPSTINLLGSFIANLLDAGTLTERVDFVALALRDLDPISWVIGSGYQNTEIVFASHRYENVVPGLTFGQMLTTHDEYLTVLVKTGLVGLLMMLVMMVMIVRRAQRLSRVDDRPTRIVQTAALVALLVILAASFAGEALHYWPLAATFWLVAGSAQNFDPLPSRTAVADPDPQTGADRPTHSSIRSLTRSSWKSWIPAEQGRASPWR
jgi:O-Antigen ligase